MDSLFTSGFYSVKSNASLLLLLVKLFHFYFSAEVFTNIDDYVWVYNFIKKRHLLIVVIPLLNNHNNFKIANRIQFNNYRDFSSCSINKFTKKGYVLNNNNLLYSSAKKIESSTSNLPGRYLDIYIIYNFIVNRYKKDKNVSSPPSINIPVKIQIFQAIKFFLTIT